MVLKKRITDREMSVSIMYPVLAPPRAGPSTNCDRDDEYPLDSACNYNDTAHEGNDQFFGWFRSFFRFVNTQHIVGMCTQSPAGIRIRTSCGEPGGALRWCQPQYMEATLIPRFWLSLISFLYTIYTFSIPTRCGNNRSWYALLKMYR